MGSWHATAPGLGGPFSSGASSRAGGGSPSSGPQPARRRGHLGLPKHLRLRLRRDFDAVFKNGRSHNDQFLVLRTLPNNLDHNRYGFVTSKKLGKAVVRNRVRRRLREIVRQTPAAPGYDVVLSAKTKAATTEFADLRDSVVRLLSRAGLGAPEASDA